MNPYTRTFNLLAKENILLFTDDGRGEEKPNTSSWIILGSLIGILLGFMFWYSHNVNKPNTMQSQTLTANPPQQVMVQNAADGNLIQ